jgi:hypothetical protein
LDAVLISGDLNNTYLKTEIIATPVKLTSTTSLMKEDFGG